MAYPHIFICNYFLINILFNTLLIALENIPNCEQIDVKTNAAPETDEDIYETALSSEDTSCCYSPLTGEYHDKEDSIQTEIGKYLLSSKTKISYLKFPKPIKKMRVIIRRMMKNTRNQ